MDAFKFTIWGYGAIVFLTGILVGMNIHSEFVRYMKNLNRVRLYSYLGTLLIMGAVILMISGSVVDHVIDSEMTLQLDGMRRMPMGVH